MAEKIFNGVRIFFEEGRWCCEFKDYIEAREKQGKKWSEKSFCDWCDIHNIEPIG
jgi:hypothetical protein